MTITLKRTLRMIPTKDVLPWRSNPSIRLTRNRQFLELLNHITENGLLDPIDVVEEGNAFRIVRGHRRFHIINHELQQAFIEAWVWFIPFEEATQILVPTERMQRPWNGPDIGQAVNDLGLESAVPLLRVDDASILSWAAKELADDPELFRSLCAQYGPRVFRMAKRCVTPDTWPLARVCRAIVAQLNYRDIEAKGLSKEERQAIVLGWEKAS